jgi:hypothetical protein
MILQIVVQGHIYGECYNCGGKNIPVAAMMMIHRDHQEPCSVVEGQDYCERCLDESLEQDMRLLIGEAKKALRRVTPDRRKVKGRLF